MIYIFRTFLREYTRNACHVRSDIRSYSFSFPKATGNLRYRQNELGLRFEIQTSRESCLNFLWAQSDLRPQHVPCGPLPVNNKDVFLLIPDRRHRTRLEKARRTGKPLLPFSSSSSPVPSLPPVLSLLHFYYIPPLLPFYSFPSLLPFPVLSLLRFYSISLNAYFFLPLVPPFYSSVYSLSSSSSSPITYSILSSYSSFQLHFLIQFFYSFLFIPI